MKLSIEELRRHLAGDTVLSDGEKDEYLAALLEVAETSRAERLWRPDVPVPLSEVNANLEAAHARLDFEEAP